MTRQLILVLLVVVGWHLGNAGRLAHAEDSPPAGGGLLGTSVFRLLNKASVRTELRVTPEQAAALDTVQVRAKAQAGPAPADKKAGAGHTRQLIDACDRLAWAVLRPEQQRRLRQIDRQIAYRNQGMAAVMAQPDVSALLTLSAAQQEQVRAANEAMRRTVAQLFKQKDPNVRSRLDAVREENDRQQKAMLTAGQLRAWEDQVLGPPFDAADLPIRR